MNKLTNKVKVEWRHFFNGQGVAVSMAMVFNGNDKLLGKGEAVAESHKPNKENSNTNKNFSREHLRKLALKNALKRTSLDKKERTKVWESYRTSMTEEPRWQTTS